MTKTHEKTPHPAPHAATKADPQPAFDPAKIAAKARIKLVVLGRHYGSGDTLRQADKTIQAAEDPRHTAALAARGWSVADTARLKQVRAALERAGGVRDTTLHGKKITNRAYDLAVTDAKTALFHGRTVLANCVDPIEERGEEGDEALATQISVALASASSDSHDDAQVLRRHVQTISAALSLAGVAAEANPRGGAEALAELASALRDLDKVAPLVKTQGAPAETETMDLLDGLIVRAARRARKAARVAARQLGDASIAAAFDLGEIKPRRVAKAKVPEGAAKEPGEPAAGEAPPT